MPRAKMTPKQLTEAAIKLYGERGWQTRLAEELGVDGSTVRRWISGAVPVTATAAAAVRCFVSRLDH